VILISWYLWRRTSEGSSSNSGEEATISDCEKIESPRAEQKVSKVNIHALFILFKINNTKCSLHRSLISTVCFRNVDDAVWIIDKRKKNGFKSNSLDLPVLCSLIDMNSYRNYIDIKIIKTVVFLLGDFWFQIMEKWYNVYILSFDQMSQLLEHARTTLI